MKNVNWKEVGILAGVVVVAVLVTDLLIEPQVKKLLAGKKKDSGADATYGAIGKNGVHSKKYEEVI